MLVSVVIPCYNSERTIAKVVGMVDDEFGHMDGFECEFVLVNDCGGDGTFNVIRELAAARPNVHGVNLMRNFGQHNALMCAMHYTRGDLVLGMDDDLQTHPSQIHKLLETMVEGDYDVVYGVYRESKNGPIKNFTHWLNKVSSSILLGRPKGVQSSNFWLITRAVRDEVIKYRNFSPYVDAIFYRTTHNIGNVVIEHHAREVGSSGYTFSKLVKLWLAYWNYSTVPLHITSVVGGITAVAGFIGGIVAIIHKLVDPTTPMGWSSLVCIVLFFSGVILLALGIIGEYLGKALLAINSTPQYIVRETVNLPESEDAR
ncbi:MAG: glycosyltransferase family 2 protein [Olegusella sp.]|nr:glycosyltransferase family 2 protein [Olegusella sp.]